MKKYILTSSLLAFSYLLMAQDGPNFPGVPIDGGLSILMGAGIAYGAKKMYDSQKNDKTEE